MKNSIGYLLTAIFLFLMGAAFLTKHILKNKNYDKYRVIIGALRYFIVFMPTIFLFIINLDWKFGLNFLPSQNSADITGSLYHLGSFIAMIIGFVLMIIQVRKDMLDQRRYLFGRLSAVDFTIFQFGLMILGIEVFKQLIYLNLAQGLGKYSWYGFPLQFCSLPMLLYPLSPLVKNKTIKNALYSFISIFTLVAGLAVMIVGGDIFSIVVSISVHTVIWHGSMVIVGLYTLIAINLGKSWKQFGDAIIVLAGAIVLVQVFNTFFHFMSLSFPGMGKFDGFFISPWKNGQNMPVLSNIRINLQNTGMHVALVGILFSGVYMFAFSLGGLIVFCISRFGIVLNAKRIEHLNNKNIKQTA